MRVPVTRYKTAVKLVILYLNKGIVPPNNETTVS